MIPSKVLIYLMDEIELVAQNFTKAINRLIAVLSKASKIFGIVTYASVL